MRDAFKLFAAIAAFVAVTILLYATPAIAEVRIYNHTVKFAPSTPASIVAKAFEPIEFSIVGQRQELSALVLPPPLDPSIIYIQQPTQMIVAEYLNQDMIATTAAAPPVTVTSLRVPGLTAGKYKIRLMYPRGEIFDEREIVVNDTANKVIVQPQGVNGPNAFFLSAYASNSLTVYPGVPAGPAFGAWSTGDKAPPDTVPLFHLSSTFSGSVLNFYTTDVAQRNALRDMGWQYNGEFVNVMPEKNGTCGAGAQPVYRAFRAMKAGSWLPTHRYTTDVTAYREWLRSGHWSAEGVAFCARVLTEQLVETF
jgi:Repeat of unknown function (DUF5648)